MDKKLKDIPKYILRPYWREVQRKYYETHREQWNTYMKNYMRVRSKTHSKTVRHENN